MNNEDNRHIHVDITTGTILKVFFIAAALVILYLLKSVVIIFLFAIVIASAVSPFATWFEKRRVPRMLGVLLLYLIVFGLVIAVSSIVIPSLSQDLSQIADLLPIIFQRVSTSIDSVQRDAPKYFDFLSEMQNILELITSYLHQVSRSAISFVIGVFGGVVSFFAIIVISFYLAVMRNGIEQFLRSVVPAKHENYAVGLWKRSELKVGKWLQGQMLLGLFVGLVVYIGLSIMNVKFALVLAILSMILEIVPIAGPVLAAIPAVLMAFIQDPQLGLWVLVFYIVVQQLENNILVPIVMGRATGLNPAVVIMSLLVGGTLAGIPGAILAVPITSIIAEILDDMARHKDTNNNENT